MHRDDERHFQLDRWPIYRDVLLKKLGPGERGFVGELIDGDYAVYHAVCSSPRRPPIAELRKLTRRHIDMTTVRAYRKGCWLGRIIRFQSEYFETVIQDEPTITSRRSGNDSAPEFSCVVCARLHTGKARRRTEYSHYVFGISDGLATLRTMWGPPMKILNSHDGWTIDYINPLCPHCSQSLHTFLVGAGVDRWSTNEVADLSLSWLSRFVGRAVRAEWKAARPAA